MPLAVESKEWFLSSYAPEGIPTSEHLKIRTVGQNVNADSIPEGHVAVQILLLSVDPYLRTMMSGQKGGLDLRQLEIDQVRTSPSRIRLIYKHKAHTHVPLVDGCIHISLLNPQLNKKNIKIKILLLYRSTPTKQSDIQV